MKITNGFIYEINKGVCKGFFNLYQARNGSIQICMGSANTLLTVTQINDLRITVYELKDFDIDLYNKFYNASN